MDLIMRKEIASWDVMPIIGDQRIEIRIFRILIKVRPTIIPIRPVSACMIILY